MGYELGVPLFGTRCRVTIYALVILYKIRVILRTIFCRFLLTYVDLLTVEN